MKIENEVVNYEDCSDNQSNYVRYFFDRYDKLKSWLNIMQEYNIKKNLLSKWHQLIHGIPKSWRRNIKNDEGNCRNLEPQFNKKQPNTLN